MIEQIAEGAETAVNAANDASRGAKFSHEVDQATEATPKPPPSHPGGLAGLWEDVKSGVSSGYQATTGAIHSAGHAAEQFGGKLVDKGTDAIRSVAGNGAANAFHSAADAVGNQIKQQVGFGLGVTEGATEALGGMAEGVGDLAGDTYKFATNSGFRGQVIHGAEGLASKVAHNPVGTAKALGSAALNAGKTWVQGAETAAKQGDLGEYLGKGVGSAVVNVGGFFVPGADAADAANVAGKIGEVSEAFGDAGKLTEGANALGDASKAEHGVEALGDASKADRGAGAARGAEGADETKPVQIKLRGVEHTIPDWHMEDVSYTKRTDAARDALRSAFPPVRRTFVKDLATNHVAELRDAGMSSKDIALMKNGRVPDGYQVHHMLPLDDGGTNATDNLVLIKNEPDHKLITRYQIDQTKGMSPGDTRQLQWPMPDHQLRVWPETPGGGAYPTIH
jgi:hypothetical protein